MITPRQLERIEWRCLGAWRCIDAATSLPVDVPLDVVVPAGTEIIRNRSGLYVINQYAQLASHSHAFSAPPADPATGSLSFAVTLRDPSGLYLARSAAIPLPRDAGPDNAAATDSLFNPVDIELYRSPSAPVGANWVPLRVSLTEEESGDALGGALLRVRSNGNTLSRGLSDWRGEALVPVVGVPITTWSEDEDAVVATSIDATLEVFFDPAAGGVRISAAQVAARQQPVDAAAPDPVRIEANPAAIRTQKAVSLSTGQPLTLSLTLDLSG